VPHLLIDQHVNHYLLHSFSTSFTFSHSLLFLHSASFLNTSFTFSHSLLFSHNFSFIHDSFLNCLESILLRHRFYRFIPRIYFPVSIGIRPWTWCLYMEVASRVLSASKLDCWRQDGNEFMFLM